MIRTSIIFYSLHGYVTGTVKEVKELLFFCVEPELSLDHYVSVKMCIVRLVRTELHV